MANLAALIRSIRITFLELKPPWRRRDSESGSDPKAKAEGAFWSFQWSRVSFAFITVGELCKARVYSHAN